MVISFKIEKELKQALQDQADKEYRSLSNYITMILKKHIDEIGVAWEKEKTDDKDS